MATKTNPITAYVHALERKLAHGDATERTHRAALISLLESLLQGVEATDEPKGILGAHPDVRVTQGEIELGYVETKDIGKDLDAIERDSERDAPHTQDGLQLKKYRPQFANLVLTDYIRFRHFRDGRRVDEAVLGAHDKDNHIRRDKAGEKHVLEMLAEFLETRVPITDSKALAKRMAKKARRIRDLVFASLVLRNEEGKPKVALKGKLPQANPKSVFYEAFDTLAKLLRGLVLQDFADMYAQTVTYGVFAARCHEPSKLNFSLGDVTKGITNIPLLKNLFHRLTDPECYGIIGGELENIVELIRNADLGRILEDFARKLGKEDPVVHFYEDFLNEFDAKVRKMRGEYYTPEQVVSYIVRSVDKLLVERFGKPDGLADPSVIVLDPAVGTGTFLFSVVRLIHERVKGRGQAYWRGYVRDKLLPRLFGFELMMAPYAVAHLKLSVLLKDTGFDLADSDRINVFLTNSLEKGIPEFESRTLGKVLSDESEAAASVKEDKTVLVVLGNPPYRGHSANASKRAVSVRAGQDYTAGYKLRMVGDGTRATFEPITRRAKKDTTASEFTFIGGLVQDYYLVDGRPLRERNTKWLQDDYVKFIRFGQWRIEKTGEGILAYITNHGYIDNPTFPGMRQQLRDAFTDIWVLDLHGNAKRGEKTPDGGKDENVFDIPQGVAIGLFVKEKGRAGNATVMHEDRFGLRDAGTHSKYAWLAEHDISNTQWHPVAPSAPLYLFSPQDTALEKEYESGWRVTDSMPVNVLGFQTHRDRFAVAFDRETIVSRCKALRDPYFKDAEIETLYELSDSAGWNLRDARGAIGRDLNWENHVIRCLYRPFDDRWCYFSTVVMDRPRRELLDHVAGKENLCLGVGRQGIAVSDPQWSLVTISRDPIDANIFRRGGVNVFPMYIYARPLELTSTADRTANLKVDFVADLSKRLELTSLQEGMGDLVSTFGPEDVFHYIYATLHSPAYRRRYAGFLRMNFPRVPLTGSVELFRKLAALGGNLVDLHLVKESAFVGKLFPEFEGNGDLNVEQVKYDPTQSRVYISKTQYFGGIEPEVWRFFIGGYQVCDRWLKERNGRTRDSGKPWPLSFDEIEEYRKIVVALRETIRLMADKVVARSAPRPPQGQTPLSLPHSVDKRGCRQ